MGARCTDTRRYTEKWLPASCYLIYQALFSGFCIKVHLGADLAQEAQKTAVLHKHCAVPRTNAWLEDWSALAQLYTPMPVPTPKIQNKLLGNKE